MQEETTSLIDVAKVILQFAVLPIGAFMWMHYKLTQAHDTGCVVNE